MEMEKNQRPLTVDEELGAIDCQDVSAYIPRRQIGAAMAYHDDAVKLGRDTVQVFLVRKAVPIQYVVTPFIAAVLPPGYDRLACGIIAKTHPPDVIKPKFLQVFEFWRKSVWNDAHRV